MNINKKYVLLDKNNNIVARGSTNGEPKISPGVTSAILVIDYANYLLFKWEVVNNLGLDPYWDGPTKKYIGK